MTKPNRHVEVPSTLRTVKKRVPKPLKRAARTALRHYGVETADQRVLPDFLIIGAKRAGTTSVWNWLVRHPHVAPMFPASQQMKSPHFFDLNWNRGLDWYRSHFATRASLVRSWRRTGFRALTGEASPYYVFHPLVAERVHTVMPKAKLILTLRNPVDRAYSNYMERRGSQAEPLPTFEEAIDAEDARLAGEVDKILADPGYHSKHHDSHSYLARGRYLEHLGPWLQRFDRRQLLILPFEEITRRPDAAFNKVQEFLGLPVVAPPALPHHHKLPAPTMNRGTRERLIAYFRPWNNALKDELKLDVDWDK